MTDPADRTITTRTRAVFWSSVVAMPLTSALTVVLLSRVHGEGELARISVVFALGLVWTVLPIATQAGTASDVTAGRGVPRPPWTVTLALALVGVGAAVPTARILDVPIAATGLPALALVPLVAVSVVRGRLIGERRFGAAAANNYVEAAVRIVVGLGLGVPFGATGVAIAIASAGAVSWAAAPRLHPTGGPLRLPAALSTTAALTVSVQGPLIVAPRVLGEGADAFVSAALPAQGVYLGLSAVAWLAVPHTLDRPSVRATMRPVVMTVAVGSAGALALALSAPLIGRVLDRSEPSRAIILVVGLGMAIAAGHWVLLQARLVRARSRVAMAPVSAVAILAVSVAFSSAAALATGVLVGQVVALGISYVGIRRDLGAGWRNGAGDHRPAPVLR